MRICPKVIGNLFLVIGHYKNTHFDE